MAIVCYLADMGTSLNIRKRTNGNTTKTSSGMVCLDSENEVAPGVRLDADGGVPYIGLRLHLTGASSMKEEHVLPCQAFVIWCKNALE